VSTRKERVNLIKKIEAARKSKVICFLTGDRPGIEASIAEDVVRPMYEHLLRLGSVKQIDLFLYSRGGDVSVPWRIVNMIREMTEKFCVLVPYKAHSAATMICLGADEIVMGPKAELGPIDPTLNRTGGEGLQAPNQISVEDVSSYISFMREKANLTDQGAVAAVVSQLANHVMPLTLGSVHRTNSHIRLVARKLLTAHLERMDESKMSAIVEALTEKMYSHGHAIGRKEASDLGLPVLKADEELSSILWNLHSSYEQFLKLNDPLDVIAHLKGKNIDEETLKDEPVAVIESVEKLDVCESTLTLKVKRQVGQLSMTTPFTLPPGIDPGNPDLPALVQHLQPQVVQMVEQEIKKSWPIIGYERQAYGTKWVDRAS
jgi:hypothetical protein